MTRVRPLRVLSVGHAYVVSLNRATLRHIAADPAFDVTVAAPRVMKDELRTIVIESEPDGSPLTVVALDAYLTQQIHLFVYNPSQITRLLRDGAFDVVHIWEEPYVCAGFQLARAMHRRRLPFCFRTAQNIAKRYPLPFRYFERSVWAWCTGWIAGASLVFDAMVGKGVPKEKGRVLTLAVDGDRFRPFDEQEKNQVATRLGLPRPIIGYVGRLTEAKGCEVLLDILRRLDPAEPWSMLLMGRGPYQARFESLARELGVGDRVTVMLLPHEEVPDVLPIIDSIRPPQVNRTPVLGPTPAPS